MLISCPCGLRVADVELLLAGWFPRRCRAVPASTRTFVLEPRGATPCQRDSVCTARVLDNSWPARAVRCPSHLACFSLLFNEIARLSFLHFVGT